jgi:hypothetical protein
VPQPDHPVNAIQENAPNGSAQLRRTGDHHTHVVTPREPAERDQRRPAEAGNPARQCGWVCLCGHTLDTDLRCTHCPRTYTRSNGDLALVNGGVTA